MPWKSLLKYKTNPKQRFTEKRAEKAKHLHAWHPSHGVVTVALLKGVFWMVEGHTRLFIWESDKYEVTPPGNLDLVVYEVEAPADVTALYAVFNNPVASKKAHDEVYGTYRETDSFPATKWFLDGRNSSGIRAAYMATIGRVGTSCASVAVDVAVREFMPEILLLDKITPNRRKFSTGVLAAALITIRAYGEAALEFWRLYNEGKGTKTASSGCDGVEALARFHSDSKTTKTGGGGGNWMIAGHALGAFEQFQEKRRRKGRPEFLEPEKYLQPQMKMAAE